MLEPLLDGLEMICGRDVDPLVTEVAENALCIELADIGVFSKEIVAFFEGIDVLAVAGERMRERRKEKRKGLALSWRDRTCDGRPREWSNRWSLDEGGSTCGRRRRGRGRPRTERRRDLSEGSGCVPPRCALLCGVLRGGGRGRLLLTLGCI